MSYCLEAPFFAPVLFQIKAFTHEKNAELEQNMKPLSSDV